MIWFGKKVGMATIVSGSNLSNGSVSNTKLETMPANTIKGNNTGASDSPLDLTVTQVKSMLGIGSSSVNVVTSPSCGMFTTASTTEVQVTNLSVTITTSGRPVILALIPAPGLTPSTTSFMGQSTWIAFQSTTNAGASILLKRGSSIVANIAAQTNTGPLGITVPSQMFTLDPVGAGTYTYSVGAYLYVGSTPIWIYNFQLLAYEL